MTSIATQFRFHLSKLHEIFHKHRATDLYNGVKNNSQDIVPCFKKDSISACIPETERTTSLRCYKNAKVTPQVC